MNECVCVSVCTTVKWSKTVSTKTSEDVGRCPYQVAGWKNQQVEKV